MVGITALASSSKNRLWESPIVIHVSVCFSRTESFGTQSFIRKNQLQLEIMNEKPSEAVEAADDERLCTVSLHNQAVISAKPRQILRNPFDRPSLSRRSRSPGGYDVSID